MLKPSAWGRKTVVQSHPPRPTSTKLLDTPLETYSVRDRVLFVKREDLCAPEGAPPFSKIRGLYKHLSNLKCAGIETVGYTETSISMAGWGVAWAAKQLGMKAVIFNPVYKDTHEELEYHRYQWEKWGAELVDLDAGMARVNFNISRKILKSEYKKSVLLPLGLPLRETIDATIEEAEALKQTSWGSVVVNIGSGTICSGLLNAFGDITPIYGIMGRTGNVGDKKMKIISHSQVLYFGAINFQVIDPGYEYTDSVEVDSPFPCNKYYDAKAYKWLVENIHLLRGPILFWNIGSDTPTNK